MDEEPLACMPVPLDIEPVWSDPVDACEGGIELFTEVFGEAGSIALKEPVFLTVPFALNVDRVVELAWGDDGQEPGFQNGVDESLTFGRDGRFFSGG